MANRERRAAVGTETRWRPPTGASDAGPSQSAQTLVESIDTRHLDALRSHLLALLDWEDAHANFDAAVEAMPPDLYGRQPADLPYSPWQLVEHMRRTQHDILDFCVNPDYVERDWPDDYWPDGPAPRDPMEWADSLAMFRADHAALKSLVENPDIKLFDQVPHGAGQTYLREILLAADHSAYHVGQLVTVRRLLGAWH